MTFNGPDGFGYLYAMSNDGHSLNLMPPNGGHYGTPSDPTLWIAFVDGDEIGRHETRAAATEAIVTKLEALRASAA